MAQADFNIANQSGSNFLVDINGQLIALATNSSGPNPPPNPQAAQFWVDTTNSGSPEEPSVLLKKRNILNTAWITIGRLTNTAWFPYVDDEEISLSVLARVNGVNSYTNQVRLQKQSSAESAAGGVVNVTGSANMFDLTGGGNVTSIAPTRRGTQLMFRFLSARTLVHSSALLLPGSVDTPVSVNDIMEFYQVDDAGNYRAFNYRPAATSPINNAGSLIFIEQTTLGADGFIDFTSFPDSFSLFRVQFENVRPASGAGGVNNGLAVQFSSNGGSSFFDAGYQYSVRQDAIGGDLTDINVQSTSAATGDITRDGELTVGSRSSGQINISNMNQSNAPAQLRATFGVQEADSIAVGNSVATNANQFNIDALRFRAVGDPGNLAAGSRIALYALRG